MMSNKPLRLVLMWHMHQPDFRDILTGEFTQPWVYLHALKDYTDMAAHLENHAGVHAVVNLVPVLLDQLEDYADQFATRKLRDPLLRLLAREDLDSLTSAERELILNQCFRANHTKMIEPYTPYKRLRDLYQHTVSIEADPTRYLSGQYLADLLTWYHLSWTGETIRRKEEAVVRLMTRGDNFCHADRMAMFEVISAQVQDIIPRYRRLAATGRVELSTTPHYHPIGPLLLDFSCAREALPEAPLPAADHYSGGRSRAMWHLESAQHTHRHRFEALPSGVWPAEGALSTPFLKLLAEHRVAWTASGERILVNTLRKAGLPADQQHDYLPRRSSIRPDRIRIQRLAWQRCSSSFHRATERHPHPLGRRVARRQRDSGRRERLGVLPVQRVLFSRRALSIARSPSRNPYGDFQRSAGRPGARLGTDLDQPGSATAGVRVGQLGLW
jgi:alpha-amylase/alpha-mannosidase (GH57 family)